MVPLIDVLMVLIIFFLQLCSFKNYALNVKLPKIESAGLNLVRNELIISIKAKGNLCEWTPY